MLINNYYLGDSIASGFQGVDGVCVDLTTSRETFEKERDRLRRFRLGEGSDSSSLRRLVGVNPPPSYS